jgi:hypothetical protein
VVWAYGEIIGQHDRRFRSYSLRSGQITQTTASSYAGDRVKYVGSAIGGASGGVVVLNHGGPSG